MPDPQLRTEDDNPYRAPATGQPDGTDPADRSLFGSSTPEDERVLYLPHETMIQAIGAIQYIKGVAALLNVALTYFAVLHGPFGDKDVAGPLGVTPDQIRRFTVVAGSVGAAISFLLGHQLTRLQNWARWVLCAITAMELIGLIRVVVDTSGIVPIDLFTRAVSGAGALIRGFIVYQLLLSDSRHVCSREYRLVVSATPQIRASWGRRETMLVGAYTIVLAAQLLRWI